MSPIAENLSDSEEEKQMAKEDYDRVSMVLENTELQELSEIIREQKL
jgi:hypothetical protein